MGRGLEMGVNVIYPWFLQGFVGGLVGYCKGLHKEGGVLRGGFGWKMLWGFVRGLLGFFEFLGEF